MNKEEGFTLIELMVVVGIIGILVAIAAPNFARYQAKARQSEAKIALSAMYAGEKAFYSEYNAYVAGMDAIGYSPEGQKRFYAVGWTANTANANLVLLGYTGAAGAANITCANNSGFTCTGGAFSTVPGANFNATDFVVNAYGEIRGGQGVDGWTINQDKILSNSTASF